MGIELLEAKRLLRESMLARRRQLSPDERERTDRQIEERFLDLAWYKNARSVFCTVSVREEVSTLGILKQILKDGKQLLVPRCRRGSMEACRIGGKTELEELLSGRMDVFFGIPQPPESFGACEPDLCLVPCLAFDDQGYRLGYGGGFYDRYLAARPRLKSLLLARENQRVEEVPREATDLPVQAILTETGLTILRRETTCN